MKRSIKGTRGSAYKLVYIEWQDAVNNPEWFFEDELRQWIDRTEYWICEAGWLIEETDKYIVIAKAFKPEDTMIDVKVLGVHKIPKGWIRKRKILKV